MASTPSPGGSETWPSSPSSSGAQNAKAKRYDRQLRLWGDHGQSALERSRVCVVGATATATEVLKALVLPGVGQFTIVDGEKIRGEDIGNNFFLERDSIGQSRGAVASRLLLEMNPDVQGDCVDESPELVLKERPDFFKAFDLVLAADIGVKALITLSDLLWEANVPLMVINSFGLLGYIRLQVREHTVVESHPDNDFEDLRLDVPFASLVKYMDSQDMSVMDKDAYLHTPYVVILYKYLQVWKNNHNGETPKNYKEKQAFKQMIKAGMREKEGIVHLDDMENFEEALKAANTALERTRVPNSVQKILGDPKCVNLVGKSENFWIIARAVKDFVANEGKGLLPVRGSIPDMFSDSGRYILLQNVYREKASADAEIVHKRVQHHLESIGRQAESISESSVKKFCREASHLRVIRDVGSIADEYMGRLPPTANYLATTLEQDPESEAAYYVILRAVDRFRSEFNTWPGAADDHVEPDIGRLKTCVAKVLIDCYPGISTSVIRDDCVHEVCRYGGAEPHAMAAFIGGCAAQEAIKMLTKQYVPIDNLFLFNAMTMNSTTLKIA